MTIYMSATKLYATYILSNKTNTVLYTGVTNNLKLRVWQHVNKISDGFTSQYNVSKLVWYEIHTSIENAIIREKKIKNLVRRKKNLLIESMNPTWKDLFETL